ncbi:MULTISPECIES: transcription elongation factor GreA [Caproicibacterium]|jgi:transcription elongation factor GreA|uniref:Transcription elongation factor GreA n=1 Tax=Caproicibacterium lactatifermentans TaxID=2666138 RepID=A0A859DM98_9FIRM|nr:transcription elongation factor GreA [Caproicibacterium lactatifermentans]ARP49519.1 transcription elongation factor GreA [Ruminococcaceae bacterium CPB6]MDD4806918.1 transcription elongation factor GreA [Oscillospiraceae bacterium]QKN23107.1 transcription elongation factor GreA [Caproicibacterium lactatifermentans]QKO30287.1 transcription elongation factor GreA [Caproicibacterium lactatifermentans]
MQKQTVMTQEGYNKLEKELEELKGVKRKEVAEKIKVALGYGDLSENSEYDEAKNEQAILEARIADVEVTLKNARILTESEMNAEQIHVGSSMKVRVSDAGSTEGGREMKLTIVGSSEADPISGRISDESAVGGALMGHSIGDKVEIEVPAGKKVYEILEVIK